MKHVAIIGGGISGLAAAFYLERERRLGCGRMAHPASFRGMARSLSVVPKPGVRPTEWQQEVGQAVAALI